MSLRMRPAAFWLLLLVALLPTAALLATPSDCESGCGDDRDDCPPCGDCVLCALAGRLATPVALDPAPTHALDFPSSAASPSNEVTRAIEHVPLTSS